jgi:predicted O-linked N-acetylglucosamine transferase (SPINDLY family)
MSKTKRGNKAASRKRRAKARQRRRPQPTPLSNADTLLQEGLRLQNAGNLDGAKQAYCDLLELDPSHAQAWHLLGVVLYVRGAHEEAINCLKNATTLAPNESDFFSNLGIAYRAAGDLSKARSALENAMRLDPQSVNAYGNFGTVCLEQRDFQMAEAGFLKAIELDPHQATAAMNLGNLWQHQGKLLDAESLYRRLLTHNPHDPLLQNNLAESLRKQGKSEEAVELLQRALQETPNVVITQMTLGRCLTNLRRLAEATSIFEQLIAQQPSLAKPYHCLGEIQLHSGQLGDAVQSIETSLELDATDAFARGTLGIAYLQMGDRKRAETCFRAVLAAAPTMSDIHSCLLFILSGQADLSPQELYEEHVNWGRQHGDVPTLASADPDEVRLDFTNRKLRIGYVSPDFRSHAVSLYFEPVLQSHDRKRFETFCYAELMVADDTTKRLQEIATHWRYTNGLSDEQVARKIQADKIDILVDLAGHTAGNRLRAFAYRPAPIQITWLGYPNTTGLAAIDYRLTCETQNPLGEPSYHTEELIRMDGGSFCFAQPKQAPPLSNLPAARHGYITFGSLHRPFKISETARDLWAAVLSEVPDSRLLVFNTQFTNASQEELRRSLCERGIHPDRIEIQNEIVGDSHLTAYEQIDIGLDAPPWAGATTTLEALWMGIPVIAYYGDRRSARSTAAIMTQVQHQELIAHSPEQFIRIAHDLSCDYKKLATLRRGLRDQTKATVVNSDHFTRELESVYRKLWKSRHETQVPPR